MELQTETVDIAFNQDVDLLNSVTHDYRPVFYQFRHAWKIFKKDLQTEDTKVLKGFENNAIFKRTFDLIDLANISVESDGSIIFHSFHDSKLVNNPSTQDERNTSELALIRSKSLNNPLLESIITKGRFENREEAEYYLKESALLVEESLRQFLPEFENKTNNPRLLKTSTSLIKNSATLSLQLVREGWEYLSFAELNQNEIDKSKSEIKIENALPINWPRMQKPDVTFDLHINPTSLEVKTHPIIKKVFLNLVYNALKFTEVAVSIHAVRTEGKMLLVVADDGTGIDLEMQQKIFEPGIQAEGAEKSTGLGLWMCKDIVTKLGGIIGVDSQRAAGSAFYVLLPEGPNQKLTENDFTESIANKVRSYRKELVE